MRQVKEMGVTYIHTYGMGRDSSPEGIEKDLAYMDLAHKHGLKVMAYLNGRKWLGARGLLDVQRIADALKDHPALGFWLLYDEPSGTHSVTDLKPYYWLLKHEAPEVPVALVEAWKKDWYLYTEVCDILQLDTYPVRDEPFPAAPLGIVTEVIGRGVTLPGANIMPVLQCMNWKAFAAEQMATRGHDPDKLRYPNPEELRYWSYSSLAQGVRGLFWWSYYRSVQGGYGWINSQFKETMLQVREFVDLVSPAHEAERFIYAQDEDVFMALWRRDIGTYLVLANGQPIARNIRRGTEGLLSEAVLEPWGHTRDTEISVTGGVIAVHAEPWETFVWRVTEPAAGG